MLLATAYYPTYIKSTILKINLKDAANTVDYTQYVNVLVSLLWDLNYVPGVRSSPRRS
jgi:hypothetical protein